MAGGSINMNKVLFDEKNPLEPGKVQSTDIIVLDTTTTVPDKTTQSGQAVHPVRRMKASDLKAWVNDSSSDYGSLTFRALGVPAGASGVRFVLPFAAEKRQALGLRDDNVAAIDVKFVGKTVSTTLDLVFATFMWHWNGIDNNSYFTDVQVPGTSFLDSGTSTLDDISITVTYNNNLTDQSIVVRADHLNPDSNTVKWAAYVTFYPVEMNTGSDGGGPEV